MERKKFSIGLNVSREPSSYLPNRSSTSFFYFAIGNSPLDGLSSLFRNRMLETFGWHTALHNSPSIPLSSLLTAHPFNKEGGILWEHCIRAIFWSLWLERNKRIFNATSLELSLLRFFYRVIVLALGWCKYFYSPFNSYSLNALAPNWKAFLISHHAFGYFIPSMKYLFLKS